MNWSDKNRTGFGYFNLWLTVWATFLGINVLSPPVMVRLIMDVTWNLHENVITSIWLK